MKKLVTLIVIACALCPLTHADVWEDLANYKLNGDAKPAPVQVDALVNQTPFNERGPIEDKLLAVLQSGDATPEAKWYCCRMLGRIGTEKSVPVMAGLLGEAKLSHYARLLLENLPESRAAGKALVEALGRVDDPLKIGLLGSLGVRGDAAAVSAIAPFTSSDNAAVAKAALQALGAIGGKKAHAAISKTRANPQAQLAAAARIQDPGQFYSVAQSVGPLTADYVSSDGQPGWRGAYYANGRFEGDPALVRNDRMVSQSWHTGSPDPKIPNDDFSVRWTGTLTPPETRTYAFAGDADDHLRFAIDGEDVLGNLPGGKKKTAEIQLKAGQAYEVLVEFKEGGGHAHLNLDWDCASKAQRRAAEQKVVDLVPHEKQRGLLGSPELLSEDDALKLALEGGNPSIRSAGFIRLVETRSPHRRKALETLLKRPDDDARASFLRTAMESDDTPLRDDLMARLGKMPAEDQRVLLGVITDKALTQYEPQVIALLASADGALQDQVIYTLGIIGGEKSFGPMYKAYQAESRPSITFAMTQLRAPSVDVQLLKTVADDPNVANRLSAMTPLMLRNPEGAVELFHKLAGPDQPEALRKAAYKALETVGTIETCKLFTMRIIEQDAWMRPSQKSLKKLCVRLDKGHDVWQGAFKPALKATSDDAARAALFMVADGAACNDAKNALHKAIRDPASPQSRVAAISALMRWSDFSAGQVWCDLMKDGLMSGKELSAAQRSLVRLISRKEIRADWKKKLELAAEVAQLSADPAFKQSILTACEGFSSSQRREYLTPLADDPDVGVQVKALIN